MWSRTLFAADAPAEDMFRSFPSIGSLAKVYGVLTFILEHSQDIDAYLQEEDRFFEEFQASYPLSAEMLEPFEDARNEKAPKIALRSSSKPKPTLIPTSVEDFARRNEKCPASSAPK